MKFNVWEIKLNDMKFTSDLHMKVINGRSPIPNFADPQPCLENLKDANCLFYVSVCVQFTVRVSERKTKFYIIGSVHTYYQKFLQHLDTLRQ